MELERSACSWDGSNELNTTTSSRARVIATLSRRSPPSRLRGPKFSGTSPLSFGEKAIEKRIVSRSSPWTFSRFLTKSPSGSSRDSRISSVPSSRSRVSIRSRCCMLKVTMPIDGSPVAFRNRATTSSTMASASTGLVRSILRGAPVRRNSPSTRRILTPARRVPGARRSASSRAVPGPGKVARRPS